MNRRPLVLTPRRPILIGGNTIRCGKSHIAGQLKKKLDERDLSLKVLCCETSRSISTLAASIVAKSDVLLSNPLETESLIDGWIAKVLDTYCAKKLAVPNRRFAKWLNSQLPIMIPLLQQPSTSKEAYKSKCREGFFQPIAEQIQECYGTGFLAEIAWVYLIRQKADICIISGARTQGDCNFGRRHNGLLLKVEAPLEVVASRHNEMGVVCSESMLTTAWDTQFPLVSGMFRIPNNFLLGADGRENKSAVQETDTALSEVVEAVIEGFHMRENPLLKALRPF